MGTGGNRTSLYCRWSLWIVFAIALMVLFPPRYSSPLHFPPWCHTWVHSLVNLKLIHADVGASSGKSLCSLLNFGKPGRREALHTSALKACGHTHAPTFSVSIGQKMVSSSSNIHQNMWMRVLKTKQSCANLHQLFSLPHTRYPTHHILTFNVITGSQNEK